MIYNVSVTMNYNISCQIVIYQRT